MKGGLRDAMVRTSVPSFVRSRGLLVMTRGEVLREARDEWQDAKERPQVSRQIAAGDLSYKGAAGRVGKRCHGASDGMAGSGCGAEGQFDDG